MVVKSPSDHQHTYRVRFTDGVEASQAHEDLMLLAKFKEGEIGESAHSVQRFNLFERVIYRCVVGSRAYGLDGAESDTDRRGIYLPPAELHWSLFRPLTQTMTCGASTCSRWPKSWA